MPKLKPTPTSPQPRKILLLGDSGTGKTGALVSLAKAGYEILLADFENQSEEVIRGVLAQELADKKITRTQHDEALARFDIETFADKTKIMGDKIKTIQATAWSAAMRQLNTWTSAIKEPQNTVLVIDSLTFAATAAATSYLQLAKKLSKSSDLDWNDYGPVQAMLKGLLELLYSPALPCNVIVNAHIDVVETRADLGDKDAKGRPELAVIDTRLLPRSIGKALAPIIPAYFNTALVCKSFGKEQGRKRFIYTRPVGLVDTKNPYPGVPDRLPIETGLADFFKAASLG